MSQVDVVVIDYGVGNLLSVQRGLEHFGARVLFSRDPECILSAPRVVLPGVGAFSDAMHALHDLKLVSVIKKIAENKTPLLGICLGMQLLCDESEEFGVTAGLGLIRGRVVAIPKENKSGGAQKIPHIGWSPLYPSNGEGWSEGILADTDIGESVYFVHSYMVQPSNEKNRIADCLYGGHKITAVIAQGNITGCQFHPEKSGAVGLRILRRFINQ